MFAKIGKFLEGRIKNYKNLTNNNKVSHQPKLNIDTSATPMLHVEMFLYSYIP